MSLRAMLERVAGKAKSWYEPPKVRDTTPIEAAPLNVRPVNSLEDMRAMILQLQKETAESGNETYEEFFDFGEDDPDFEEIPSPAQSKFDAIEAARNHDFEQDIAAAKAKYEAEVKAKAVADLKAELKAEAGGAPGDRTPQAEV